MSTQNFESSLYHSFTLPVEISSDDNCKFVIVLVDSGVNLIHHNLVQELIPAINITDVHNAPIGAIITHQTVSNYLTLKPSLCMWPIPPNIQLYGGTLGWLLTNCYKLWTHSLPMHAGLSYLVFPWLGEPSSVPAVDDWIRQSEQVWRSVHVWLWKTNGSRLTDKDILNTTINLVRGYPCVTSSYVYHAGSSAQDMWGYSISQSRLT